MQGDSQLSASFVGKVRQSGASKRDASSGFNEELHRDTTPQFQAVDVISCLGKKWGQVFPVRALNCSSFPVWEGFRGALFLIKRPQPQYM